MNKKTASFLISFPQRVKTKIRKKMKKVKKVCWQRQNLPKKAHHPPALLPMANPDYEPLVDNC